MSTVGIQKRSFESPSSSQSSGLKSLKTMPFDFSPIMEESYVKEKQSADSPKNSSRSKKLVTKLSMGEAPLMLPRDGHQSLMVQNGMSSVINTKVPNSVIEPFNARNSSKYQTFTAESLKKNQSNSSHLSMVQGSDAGEPNINVKFVKKEGWSDSNVCHICEREFKKMSGVFEHHCRACGQAVCGECSMRKIAENRVCDICYFKANNARGEKRREDQIKTKRATIKTYKHQLKREKDEFEQLIKKKEELKQKMEVDEVEQTKTINGLQKERDKVTEMLAKKKDTNVKLRETLAVDKTFLKDKESEFDELRNKINSLKVQINQKRNNYDSKKEELTRLFQHLRKYEESPSFINLINNLSVDTACSPQTRDTSISQTK